MQTGCCYHCGDQIEQEIIKVADKEFCCNGCKTVYEILSESDLSAYYDFESNPGISPKEVQGKYDFLDNELVVKKLLDFQEDNFNIVTLFIPNIHCSSCIWVLENLQKLNSNVIASRVDFTKKKIQITYKNSISLKKIAELLANIGYDPYISLQDGENKKTKSKSYIYKLGIAGFAFGNVMFLSFPDYFQEKDFWLDQYRPLFRLLMFCFSLPVVFYAASDYFMAAYKGLRQKNLNIDVPIALGIVVLFTRSTYEVFMDVGLGYFDSLTGLVFFLLIGRFFQQKTYEFLSFERDYKSYFPIAVTTIQQQKQVVVPVNELQVGDKILIRNEEIIPADGVVLSNNVTIDYSFVTGESYSIQKQEGSLVYAGGKVIGTAVEIEITKTVSQSYLTKLWSANTFEQSSTLKNITDTFSKSFTIRLLVISLLALLFWLWKDPSKVINVVTAILIVACPCALALSAPFALGNMIRIFGRHKFYLKDAQVIENLSTIDTILFDKTGTLTSTGQSEIKYFGEELSLEQQGVVKSMVKNSNHPLSRAIYQSIQELETSIDSFDEIIGKGLKAAYKEDTYLVGSYELVNVPKETEVVTSKVFVAINNEIKGYFIPKNQYRLSIFNLLNNLVSKFKLIILSGDNNAEEIFLKDKLSKSIHMLFHQSPNNKLEQVKILQNKGRQVMMVGDGLNDAGALAQSNVGIAVAENVNVFSPASDVIIDAHELHRLEQFMILSKKTINIIKWSFALSILYNIVGLSFAVTAQLTPIVAAILMPLSSITIVVFVTVATNLTARKVLKP